eukprot:scaffold4662_cov51-Attheya_sp.AAC.4
MPLLLRMEEVEEEARALLLVLLPLLGAVRVGVTLVVVTVVVVLITCIAVGLLLAGGCLINGRLNCVGREKSGKGWIGRIAIHVRSVEGTKFAH